MALPHLTSLSCCTPTLLADLSGQLTSCSWWCLKLGLSPEGIEHLPLQLQNFGRDCLCTLDRHPLCLILKLFLKPTSFLWLLTPGRVLILCVYFTFLYFYVCGQCILVIFIHSTYLILFLLALYWVPHLLWCFYCVI